METLLEGLELDAAGLVRAEMARVLAAKLDEARLSDAGAVAMALAGISKELRGLVDVLTVDPHEEQAFVASLFG